jgi:hypothetical protein
MTCPTQKTSLYSLTQRNKNKTVIVLHPEVTRRFWIASTWEITYITQQVDSLNCNKVYNSKKKPDTISRTMHSKIMHTCISVYIHVHIVTFCPTYIPYMNLGVYILWLFVLPTYGIHESRYIYIVTFCPTYIHVKQKYKLWLFVRQDKKYRLWLFVLWLFVLGVLWLFVLWLSVCLPLIKGALSAKIVNFCYP